MIDQRDLYTMMGGPENTGLIRDGWFSAVPGIVAINIDPEHQHRIKVIIPAVDENMIFDKWIDRMVIWTGPQGYGDYHPPSRGSEVLLFGRMGQKHNLFYISRYNEDYLQPEELRGDEVRGFKTDGDYLSIADRDYEVRARNIILKADDSLRIETGGSVHIEAGGEVRINAAGGVYANGVRIG